MERQNSQELLSSQRSKKEREQYEAPILSDQSKLQKQPSVVNLEVKRQQK
jgi:hypothetical protein